MTLDDLRRLDPRDIGSWPVVPKLGALLILLLLIVFAGYWFDWKNQLEELAQARDKEQELRTAFLDKQKQAVNLEASPWLEAPSLVEVKATRLGKDSIILNEFILNVTISRPKEEAAGARPGAPAAPRAAAPPKT